MLLSYQSTGCNRLYIKDRCTTTSVNKTTLVRTSVLKTLSVDHGHLHKGAVFCFNTIPPSDKLFHQSVFSVSNLDRCLLLVLKLLPKVEHKFLVWVDGAVNHKSCLSTAAKMIQEA